jgi:hypothetical protein
MPLTTAPFSGPALESKPRRCEACGFTSLASWLICTGVGRIEQKNARISNELLPARNKLISHSDRKSILDGFALGGAAEDEWDAFWRNLEEFVQTIIGMSLDIVCVPGLDAHLLLKALKQSACGE